MARLTKRHRLAIARGVRRYWKRVRTTARQDNTSIRDARTKLKTARLEEQRQRRRITIERGWSSPDPEGEAAFNLEDVDKREPPPWTPRISERLRGQSTVTMVGYWEYRADPSSPAVSEDFKIEFDPGSTTDEFWSYYYEALRELHDETLEGLGGGEKYERFGIYITRMF